MAAIGALTASEGMLRRFRQHGGVVLRRLIRRFVRHGFVNMLRRVVTDKNRRHGRTRQRIVDALHRRQGDAERRTLRVEQPSARIAFHDRDADVMLFTKFIQFNTFRGDSIRCLPVLLREIIIDVFRRGQHVERRVDGEQNVFDQSALHDLLRKQRIVRAHADMADDTLRLQFLHIRKIFRMKHFIQITLIVHIMDHAEIDVIRLQPFQQIFKGGLHLAHVTCADVLAVLPSGADMALYDPS